MTCVNVEQLLLHCRLYGYPSTELPLTRGVAKNLFWGYKSFLGGIKLLNSRSDVILPHKKFTWADFGGINTDIHPRRYAPATHMPGGP